MDLTKSEILRTLEAHAPTIRRYGVRSLGLFGSRAHGTPDAESDLDFVVEFDVKSFDAYMDLKAFLEQLFEVRVDLVLKDAIKRRPLLMPITCSSLPVRSLAGEVRNDSSS